MAEDQDFAHDTLYRALNQPLALFFELSLELCKAMSGLWAELVEGAQYWVAG